MQPVDEKLEAEIESLLSRREELEGEKDQQEEENRMKEDDDGEKMRAIKKEKSEFHISPPPKKKKKKKKHCTCIVIHAFMVNVEELNHLLEDNSTPKTTTFVLAEWFLLA